MNVNKIGLIAVFAAMLMLFSVFVSAEGALPRARLEDANTAVDATDVNGTSAENTNAEGTAAGNGSEAKAERAAERAENKGAIRGAVREALSIPPESLGDGLTQAERQRFGPLMSALAKRASELRAESDLTGDLRARYIRHLNDALHKYRQTARAEMQERVRNMGLDGTVAMEMARRADVVDMRAVAAEIDPAVLVDELAAIADTPDEAQLKEMLKAQVKDRARLRFWQDILHRARNNPQFRQHLKDKIHEWMQRHSPAIVKPGVEATPQYVRRLGPEYVRGHFDIEAIRNMLRNRIHAERQAATALPEIVRDIQAEAGITPFVVPAEEINPAEIRQE